MDEKRKLNISKIKFYFLIFLVFLSFCFSIYAKINGFDIEEINTLIKSKYGPLYFIFFYTTISFLPIPFAPTMFLGALVFPFFQAVFYTLIGSIIFSTIAFYLARFLGRDYLEYLEQKNQKLKMADLKIRENPIENIMLLRLFFLIPGEVINVYAGMSKIKYRDFIFATIVGVIPVIFASIGLIRSRLQDDTIGIILSLVGFAIFFIVPIIFAKKLQNSLRQKFIKLKSLKR